MRRSGGWRTFWMVLAGLFAGTVLGNIVFVSLHAPFLNSSTLVNWQPSGDFGFIKYDLNLQVRINLLGVVGMGGGYWLSRR